MKTALIQAINNGCDNKIIELLVSRSSVTILSLLFTNIVSNLTPNIVQLLLDYGAVPTNLDFFNGKNFDNL